MKLHKQWMASRNTCLFLLAFRTLQKMLLSLKIHNILKMKKFQFLLNSWVLIANVWRIDIGINSIPKSLKPLKMLAIGASKLRYPHPFATPKCLPSSRRKFFIVFHWTKYVKGFVQIDFTISFQKETMEVEELF